MSDSDDNADSLARLADEFLERHRRGERPALSEYTARHPELAEQIRELFSALLVMEAVRPGPAAVVGAAEIEEPTERPEAFGLAHAPGALALPAVGGRYQLLEEIGRGGMAAVLRARDPHLGRDLAVKVMRADAHDKPELLHRFVEEAQVTGQLQHPGTVPVHDIGLLEDGRPFIAMKLVRGRTLVALLEERASPADNLARFLGIFGQVCQTLAYAHSMGVLHRDLKPSNIMVGAFGEVQVMDWGLAKVLRPGDQLADDAKTLLSTIRTLRTDTDQAQSFVGQALGTPAYMAPEQARGEVDRLDERCDVFGLGGILCEILTGQPPFTGSSVHEVVGRARAADLTDTFRRLDGCGAEGELVRLARACLAPAPTDRPRDAGAVAAAVTAYQDSVAQRLRQAELERAEAQVKAREERKRRKLWAGLAAAAALLIAGGVGGAWWLQQRRQAADAAVADRIAEARLLLDQARHHPLTDPVKYPDALKAARQAWELAGTGGASAEARQRAADLLAELEDEVKAAGRDRRLVTALADVRAPFEGPRSSPESGRSTAALAEPNADEQFAEAFRTWAGLDIDATPTAEAAARLKGRPPAVRTEIIAALDQWSAERRRLGKSRQQWEPLGALAEALEEPTSGRPELRALLARNTLRVEYHLALLGRELMPCASLTGLVPGPDSNRLRRLTEATNPATEPVLGVLTLARALHEAGDPGRAERLLQAAVQARPQEVVLYHALAKLMESTRPPRWQQAAECYAAARALRPELGVLLAQAQVKCGRAEEGLALCERLAKEQADNPWVHFGRGFALHEQRRYKEAEAAYRDALRLKADYPEAHNNLSAALYEQRRFADAAAAFREAMRLKPKSAPSYDNLGLALLGQRRFTDAERAFRKSAELQPGEPMPLNNLAIALREQERYAEAEEVCRAALGLQPGHFRALNNLGTILMGQGRAGQAEAAFRQGIHQKPDQPEIHANLSVALFQQGKCQDAEAAARQAIRLDPDHAVAYLNLGRALDGQRRYAEAVAAYHAVIRLQPDHTVAYNNLAVVLGKQNRFAESEAACREVLRRIPDVPPALCNLGNALEMQGRFAEALACYRRGHELGSKDPHWGEPSALWVQRAARRAALAKRLTLVLEGKDRPADVAEHLEFTKVCRLMKRYPAAVRLYGELLAANPALANDVRAAHRYNGACMAVLAATLAGPPADKERARFRKQALDWLRADLAIWARERNRTGLGKVMTLWQQDADLAAVRDPQALAKLPQPEREQWQRLWADVELLRTDSLEQARAHAARREWRRAAEWYARALERAPTDDGHVWFEYAAVLLLSGDRPGYVKACSRMIEACGKDGGPRPYHVARACTLAPEAIGQAARSGQLAQAELDKSAGEFWSLTQQAALHYRAGRFKKAVPLLEKSLGAETKEGRAVVSWLWLALAEHRLGKAKEARRWLDRAQEWLDPYRDGMPPRAEEKLGLHLHNWLEAHALRNEAEALLGGGSARPKGPDPSGPKGEH
jgi:serine/threonine-protein kinase